MRRTSVRELHINTSELVRAAQEGDVIVIERRGEPVAELRPIAEPAFVPFPDLTAFRKRFPMSGSDSTQIVSEDRDRMETI